MTEETLIKTSKMMMLILVVSMGFSIVTFPWELYRPVKEKAERAAELSSQTARECAEVKSDLKHLTNLLYENEILPNK